MKPILLGSAVVAGALTGLGMMERPANADYTIAYCDGSQYAINIHYPGNPGSSSELNIRIFYRPDRITFLNTAANRAPNPEGYAYSNIYGENQWEMFISNDGTLPCTLSRDGTVIDRGTATMRESPSGD